MEKKVDIKKAGKKGAGFFKEFGKFISQGNVIDLAVGVIIGAAFKSVVDSLVADIVMPFITGLIGSIDLSDVFVVFRNSQISYGNFIAQIINFVLMGFVIFLFVKIISSVRTKVESLKKKEEEETTPTTKVCPFCKSEIHIDATRCPNCTSELKD